MNFKRVIVGPVLAAPAAFARMGRGLAAAARWAGALLLSLLLPGAVIVEMLLLGSGCTVASVWMLAGLPWALLAAGLILFTLAGLALRGMFHG